MALLLASLPRAAGSCAPWCNAYTCEVGECNGCNSCAAIAAGAHCEWWCNFYTCGQALCAGCAECAQLNGYCASWCTEYNCEHSRECTGCQTCKQLVAGTQCASWCNVYTCALSLCQGCETCAQLTSDGVCEPWCNAYTCYSDFCKGCDACSTEAVPDIPAFDASSVEYVNLAASDSNLQNYAGGFYVNGYAFFVPRTSGYVARLDVNDFTVAGVSFLNLAAIDANLESFAGGFTDGTFAYFVPYLVNRVPYRHGYLTRVALNDFSTSGVSFLDLSSIDDSYRGFQGGFTDGTYAYLVPHRNNVERHGLVVRVALGDFSASGVTVLDLSSSNSNLKGFIGGLFDSTHGYFIPNQSGPPSGYVARLPLSDFSESAVEYLNVAESDSSLRGFAGGFLHGTGIYMVPYTGGGSDTKYLTRFSTTDFSSTSVMSVNVTTPSGDGTFWGGFTDSMYGYIVPHGHGTVVRVMLSDFSSSGISYLDLSKVDPNLQGFAGGFTDGRYGYFVPNRQTNTAAHAYVARIPLVEHRPTGGSSWSP